MSGGDSATGAAAQQSNERPQPFAAPPDRVRDITFNCGIELGGLLSDARFDFLQLRLDLMRHSRQSSVWRRRGRARLGKNFHKRRIEGGPMQRKLPACDRTKNASWSSRSSFSAVGERYRLAGTLAEVRASAVPWCGRARQSERMRPGRGQLPRCSCRGWRTYSRPNCCRCCRKTE